MIQILTQAGWKTEHNALGITHWYSSTKYYPTAAGGNTAIIYCDTNNNLTADYRSEGNNVLAYCQGTPETINDFLTKVEHKISKSYARKLSKPTPLSFPIELGKERGRGIGWDRT